MVLAVDKTQNHKCTHIASKVAERMYIFPRLLASNREAIVCFIPTTKSAVTKYIHMQQCPHAGHVHVLCRPSQQPVNRSCSGKAGIIHMYKQIAQRISNVDNLTTMVFILFLLTTV